MVKFIVLWINSLPSNGGLSTTISTREIIKITTLYFKRHFKVEFGAYCKTHEDNSPTNTMLVHTNGGIGLGLSNNRQCGYKLLCLSTAGFIKRCNFTDIPIPQEVIVRTNAISSAKRQTNSLTFGDRYINTKTRIVNPNP